MIAPVFEVRASFLCVLHTTNFCRHLRHRLRSFATARGISAVTMLTKDPADFTPDEAAYRSHVNMFDAVVAAFYASLPPDAGPALRDGDPFPLFSGPWFRTPAHGHLFATWSIPFYTYAVEHHLGGDPRAADPSIFRSQGFVAVLDGCVAAARLFRAQIRADPELRCAQFSVLYDLLKVAAVNFAAANLMPPGEAPRSPFAQDLAAVSRYVDGIAANYGPVVARTAANLRRSVAEAGIDLGAVGEEGEVPGKLGLLRFRKVEGDPGSALAISVASVDEASRKFAATEMAD
ncbi:hypothetical protein DFJ74DRAFT_693832 [Hyaloraphidium curvatum]|nr:hypothetical protein DFJ74DRAFT_693832 [Hyaloraphidium curvatum]